MVKRCARTVASCNRPERNTKDEIDLTRGMATDEKEWLRQVGDVVGVLLEPIYVPLAAVIGLWAAVAIAVKVIRKKRLRLDRSRLRQYHLDHDASL